MNKYHRGRGQPKKKEKSKTPRGKDYGGRESRGKNDRGARVGGWRGCTAKTKAGLTEKVLKRVRSQKKGCNMKKLTPKTKKKK